MGWRSSLAQLAERKILILEVARLIRAGAAKGRVSTVVVQRICNAKVVGSNPTLCTNK